MNETVWILNHYAVSPNMAGGTRHYDLSVQLARRGYKPVIFASDFSHSTKQYAHAERRGPVRETFEGVDFVWLKTLPYIRNDTRRVLNMLSYGFAGLRASNQPNPPDIIIGSSPHPVAALLGWWLGRRYKVPFLFEVRDLWPQTAVDMGSIGEDGIVARSLYCWERLMYQKADNIIVLLPEARNYIASRGIPAEKIDWVPNGVDLERSGRSEPLPSDSEISRTLSRLTDKFKVMYTGAHGPANGLEVVLGAAKRLLSSEDLHFILVGDGPEKHRLIDMVERESICNVTFVNPVRKSLVPAVLREADLLVHSLKPLEVFQHGISPNKLFDYLASGRPIVMSANPANDIIGESGAGITVEAGDERALAEAIMHIRHMGTEERAALGRNGREYVAEYHSMEVLGERLCQILDRLLSGQCNT